MRVTSLLSRWTWLTASALALTAALAPLSVRSAHGLHREVVAALAAVAAVLVVAGVGLRALRLPRSVVVVYLVGVALRVAYLFVTPFSVRTHDVDQHVEYVDYLLAHHAIPSPGAGWAFYHPPFYFILAALLWRALMVVGVTARSTLLVALQVQSLAYFLGFLAFCLLTGELWLARLPDDRLGPDPGIRSRLRVLFAALMCLWPSGIIHSTRVGNDDLFYLFFGGALFFTTRWWQDRRDRDLHVAASFAALATLTKSNGLVVFMLLAVLFGTRIALDEERSVRAYARRAWPGVVLFFVSAGLTLGRAAIDTLSGRRHNLLVGNADRLTKALAVGNGAANYLWFDVKMFVTQPYSSSWVDDSGRQYFWNFALKTSLLGDFQFDGAWLSNLAVLLSASLLAILGCLVLGAARQTKQDLVGELPLFAAIALAFASLAALRMSIPMACSNDFRYVLPILMPAIYLYVRALVRFRAVRWGGLARCGEAAGWSFAGLSLAFFVLLAKG
jgi:hypothetical protein